MKPIRKLIKADLDAAKSVIESTGLFPAELLDGMTADYFSNPHSTDIWLTVEIEGTPVAIAYCAPERMTEGTYNLYLIAVHKSFQGKGVGGDIMRYVEDMLAKNHARILIVETSGLPEFEQTRRFYDKCGYTREAVIREFYAPDEDKVVFWKKLTPNKQVNF